LNKRNRFNPYVPNFNILPLIARDDQCLIHFKFLTSFDNRIYLTPTSFFVLHPITNLNDPKFIIFLKILRDDKIHLSNGSIFPIIYFIIFSCERLIYQIFK